MRIMKSDEVKDTMKESPRRYTNPFLSDEENEKVNMWNNQELYTDRNVMECDLPELLVCYKEGAFHVKDICVDEGIPHGEKILFDEDNHGILCINEDKRDDISNDMEDYHHIHMDIGDNIDEGIEKNLDIPLQELQNPMPDDDDAEECGKKEEDVEDNGISENAPEELKCCAESDTVVESVDDYIPPEEQMESSGVLLDDKDRPLPSLKSLLDSINDKDQQPCQSSVEESSKRPLEENEAKELGTSVEISNESMEGNSGKTVISNGLVHERGEGESSFSVAGPVSGLISYSGQIAFSGSVSLRSDSSTTSTRSFAFPILQTEWNSSPVRMAKADRRRLQKHRGWRNGLLCCRF